MPDLSPRPALASQGPITANGMTLVEVFPVDLASVTARRGQEEACAAALAELEATVPSIGHAVAGDPYDLLCVARHQWMVCAERPDLAADLSRDLAGLASVTEQSGAWVMLDLSGARLSRVLERLCNLPSSARGIDTVLRTDLSGIGGMVWRRSPEEVRIFGPRASARDLARTVETAMGAIGPSDPLP